MNCEQEKYRQMSRSKFQKVRSYTEFLEIWSSFYQNRICIPTYFDTFVGAEDNPQATQEIGDKFREIVKHGVIPYDFQTNLPGIQKEYITAFVPTDLIQNLSIYINRYPGYIAFGQTLKSTDYIQDLYVTYDATDIEIKKSIQTGVFLGDPFTLIGYNGVDEFSYIQEWLDSDFVTKTFNPKHFGHITIIDTEPSAPKERVVDTLLAALKDNKNIAYQTINKLDLISR
jgi:hypothetical protein